jgi:hypothetical protein
MEDLPMPGWPRRRMVLVEPTLRMRVAAWDRLIDIDMMISLNEKFEKVLRLKV